MAAGLGARLRRRLRSRDTVVGGIALAAGLIAASAAGMISFAAASAAPEPAPTPPRTAPAFEVGADFESVRPHRDVFRAGSATAVSNAEPLGPAVPSGEAQRIAAALVAARGWSDGQFACLATLWGHESGWSTHAANANGAYGIPQAYPGSKMGVGGGDWRNDAAVQIRWGLGYIAGRYGTPCGAWSHFQAAGSY